MATAASNWIELPSIANVSTLDIFTVTSIHNNEYLFVSQIFNAAADKQSIYKFSAAQNKWTAMETLSQNLHHKARDNRYHSTCFNADTNELYIFNEDSNVLILNLDTEACEAYPFGDKDGSHASSVIADGKLHVIGGWEYRQHRVFDQHSASETDEKHTNALHTFKAFRKGYVYHRAVYVRRTQRLLLMGGCDSSASLPTRTDAMHAFSLVSQRWKRLPISLPFIKCHFGCVLTKNERYVLTFGGGAFGAGDSAGVESIDEIWILDLECMQWRKSKMKTPEKGKFEAVLMDNTEQSVVVVYGFVRECWRSAEFDGLTVLPDYLIDLLHEWYRVEYVHLMQRYKGSHWKLNIDLILND